MQTLTPKEAAKVAALKRFMEQHQLKPHPWATAAGLRSSTLYNFLAGKSHSLSSNSLERLALAAGATVDEILSGVSKSNEVPDVLVRNVVGVFGRLFEMDKPVQVKRPPGIHGNNEVLAALVDGDGLHPIPSGWTVFYEAQSRDPAELVGKLAVVTINGNQQFIREIRRGSQAGLYTLLAWGASPIENALITEAHCVISISQ